MRFATVGSITLHFSLDGLTNGVPLVFINSLGCDLRIWDTLIPHFAAAFPIIRYDKRGHGLSDCPPAPYTIRDHTRDLANLLVSLEVKEAILIGISVGGMIALDYAATYPHRVKALILSDTAPKIGSAEMWNERIATVEQHGIAHLGDAIMARWFAPSFSEQHPAVYRGYTNMLTRTPVAGYTATCEAIRDADLTEAAGTVATKSLVLCGAEDASTPPELVRGLADALPDARFDLIEKAGHLPCIEQPDAMATRIWQFLEENGYV